MSYAALTNAPTKKSGKAPVPPGRNPAPTWSPWPSAAAKGRSPAASPVAGAMRPWSIADLGARGTLQRKADGQSKADGHFAPSTVPPVVHKVLGSPGQPLDPPTRGYFEQRFHYDFSRVRIHTDGEASRSAAAVGARAYTVGPQIVFAQGIRDRRLLGHELTHVVQQDTQSPAATSLAVLTDTAAEQEADRAASHIEAGHAIAPVNPGRRGVIQRDPAPQQAELGYIEEAVLEAAASPAAIFGSTGHDMFKGVLRGFYVEMKTEGGAHTDELIDHVKHMFRNPSEIGSFLLHYAWGLVKGIFSPITGLFDLGKLIVKLAMLQAQIQVSILTRGDQLMKDAAALSASMGELGNRGKKALDSLLQNKLDTLRALGPWFTSLERDAVTAAESGGRSAGKALLAEISKPLPELGETAGEIIGTVLVNIVLFAFTDGIGNAITQIAGKIGELGSWLGKFGKAGDMLGSLVASIGELIGTVGGWIAKAETGLAKLAETVLKPLMPLLEEFGRVMGGLRTFLRDLLGASEKAAASEAGNLAGGAARKLDEQGAQAVAPKALPATPHPAAPHATPHAPAPDAHAPKVGGQADAHPAPAAKPAKDADVIDLAAEREKRAIAAKARADAAAKARKVVPRQQVAVGDNRPRAAFTDEEIAAEHADVTTHRGQGDQISKGDQVDVRKTANSRTYEYDPWSGDSALLGDRLGPPPGPGYQAHHMVPAGEERAAALRNFMKERGWRDINDVDNGVWLPTHNAQDNLGGEFKHEFTFDNDHFNDEYFSRMEEILMKDPKIGASGLRLKLRNIRAYLRRGMLPPASL